MRKWLLGLALALLGAVGANAQCGAPPLLTCSTNVWMDLPNTKLSSVWPNTSTYSDIQGGIGPTAIYGAWSGGWADTIRSRAMIWGGGHADYFGNEVYALNLLATPATLVRLDEPTRNPNTSCNNGAYQDGRPCSRHSYNFMAYSPISDEMINFSGSLPPGGSFCTEDVWRLAVSSLPGPGETVPTWTAVNGTPSWNCNSLYFGADYDPNSQRVFFADGNNIFAYNTTTHVMTNVGGTYGARNTLAASGVVIDPVHKWLFVMGGSGHGGTGGNLYRFDISNPASVPSPVDQYTAANNNGCSPWTGASSPGGPGVKWYPYQAKIVMWSGGSSVGLYDPVANSCTTVTPTGGPPPCTTGCVSGQQNEGTFGRFQYIPVAGGFSLCNDPNQNCMFLRLDPLPSVSFQARCNAAGVLSCESLNAVTPATRQAVDATFTNGFSGAGTQANDISDNTIFTSGGSSLKMHWPANLGSDNCCQNWTSYFGAGGNNRSFGNNSDFYAQFEFQADANWVTHFVSDSFPKLWISHSVSQGSCSNMSLVAVNSSASDTHEMYTNCSGQPLYTCSDGVNWALGCASGDFYGQQGWTVAAPFTGYQCDHSAGNNGPDCFKWAANTWYTMYYHVHIGTFGTSSSTVEAYVGLYGQQMRKLLNAHNINMTSDGSAGFNVMDLVQFMTAHSGSNLAANVWFNEYINSSLPICPTGGVSPDGALAQNGTPCVAGTLSQASTLAPPTNLHVVPLVHLAALYDFDEDFWTAFLN